MRRVHFDYGKVCVRVSTDDLCWIGLVAAEADRELLRSFDDVVVGQYVTLIVNYGA